MSKSNPIPEIDNKLNYISKPSYDKHPDRLCLIARLFGLKAKLLSQNAVILELGCGTGSNLIPVALSNPNSSFIGVDISKEQIAIANQHVQSLNLKNIKFIAQDLNQTEQHLWQSQTQKDFDYILVHGVFSWVPTATQDSILQICSSQLASNGVCYISYNVLPGFEVRNFLRHELQNKFSNLSVPTQTNLQEIRDFLLNYNFKNKHLPFQAARLNFEINHILQQSDGYIFYELLAEHNQAFYFQELTEHIKSFGLKYLGDSKLNRINYLDLNKNPEVYSDDFIETCEQEADFCQATAFRGTLFCKNEALINRKPNLDIIEDCYLSSKLVFESDNFGETYFYDAQGVKVSIRNKVTQEILKFVIQEWPNPREIKSLAPLVGMTLETSVKEELFKLFKQELLDLYLSCSTDKKPISPYVKIQLETQDWITNYRHEYVKLTPNEIKVAKLLDATNSLQDISKKLTPELTLNEIEDILAFFKEIALTS
ncbi:MAG: methyltransferase domain-containing protein [Deltaproteobacteria bacterium]|jgi:SAM-dependent methyltransferase/methyltransferase-like protein|nr:methyltransferase domain-containing protein [Deltaproteobacteria bacterium]